ncbi:MAG: crossover junction endodeoxyribonuclease RuvC, partial [Deltaproteobacteria bacterium]|nr:crossover junction endodeoxyribonuclease RuvC [Deltaproteobacteria bacterium]
MKSSLKVIGIDPGLANTGFGIVEGNGTGITGHAFGTIRPSRHDDLACRLNRIYSEISTL